jgi:cytochrome d ubiquinol oxidase subunit II
VLLFTCFPPAFALLGTVLHIPLTLMLIGIVLRGSAFAFRAHQELPSAAVRRWERVFAVASTATPVFLGVCLGAVASGAVRPPQGRDFVAGFVAPWLTPFCFAVGALALSLFAFLAAVYLTLEARETALREDFRRRALGAAVAVLATAAGCLALAPAGAPRIASALLSLRALPLQLAAAAAAIGAVAALWLRRYVLARVAAAAQASVILWGWALAQYPYLVPPTQTIRAAAAPEPTLRLVLWSLAAGACALFPSLFYLFRVFKGGRRDELRRD